MFQTEFPTQPCGRSKRILVSQFQESLHLDEHRPAEHRFYLLCVCVCVVLGFELRAYPLNPSTSPFFVKGFLR
jgi:hypothetical protein